MIKIIDIKNVNRLRDYKNYANLSGMVNDLYVNADSIVEKLRGRTVWMINSTADGGGVAEMMPKMVSILRQLGVNAQWLVFNPENKDFFQLTKRIHNLIHDFGTPGFSDDERALYETTSIAAADQLEKIIPAHDIMVVHDPQPLGAGAEFIRRSGIKSIWRCHIGFDKKTTNTESAWKFLEPYTDNYDHAVFSTTDYLPSFLREKSSIISPAIDPLSHKNRDISSPELISILCRSGIIQNGHHSHFKPFWKRKALRLDAEGNFTRIKAGDGFDLLYRPTVTQISRWDRLKGWESLVEGFVMLKRKYRKDGNNKSLKNLRLLASQLVMAGPEPSAVQDDPEGTGVIEELRNYYKKLPAVDQKDISILSLPMSSRSQNHLMVNALQRSSYLVVQNSIQEGFGLTVTEAMWKQVPVLGTTACGLRQQIRNGKDGRLTINPKNSEEISNNLEQIFFKPKLLEKWSKSAQKRVYKKFLIFNQIEKWLNCMGQIVN